MNEIRKVTLSGILCENMDRMITISPRALEVEGATNGRVPCSEIPRVDYTKFGISPRQTFGDLFFLFFAKFFTVDLLKIILFLFYFTVRCNKIKVQVYG